ncbi:hypothetical protein SDC9_30257 [bioreactor metagenome]|uniref:Sporulation stage II protein D amidase enhancer LytB N-terminal domain-containing protein n=1 Tax=bioreactor metagenome TaxID=1076179 RepID=A0A644V056_9ZZZZ|nr:SpoIID/LytB domain-containing protein [Negativicutes bacterium]
MRTRIMCLVLILCSFVLPGYAYQSMSKEPDIRVGILSNQPNVVVSANIDFSIIDSDTNKVIAKYKPNEKVSISSTGSQMTVNGKAIKYKNLVITLKEVKGECYNDVNRRRYRGQISLHQTIGKKGLTVVNTLPLEEYLLGVIAKEISPDWPVEAVKAQVVAARTYALASLNKHKNDGYDVCATTDCQVYGGRDSEANGATKAVDATYGEAIYYQGKLISAYFHSSSGGYTENSENVWGGAYPYLQGVADYDQKAPYYKWEKKYTVRELEALLKIAGYNVGSLRAIELSSLTKQPVHSADRGVSGRVKEIRFVGTNGTAYIPGNKIRSILALNSTLFDIAVIVSLQKPLEFEITDSAGDHQTKEVDVNLPAYKQKPFLNDKGGIYRISNQTNDTVVFNGSGWGHGIGLSQWGAKAMAETAPKGDSTYFKEILKHYYQGVDIKKAYR